jgi:CheY-like chemotaxis protein
MNTQNSVVSGKKLVTTVEPSVVVVDPQFGAYKSLADGARRGRLSLHMRSSGAEAIKLARRMRVDAWLIAPDLDDMSGLDLVELLQAEFAADSNGVRPKLALVHVADSGSRQLSLAGQEAAEAGADSLLTHPITFSDLERLLGLPAEERSKVMPLAEVTSRAFEKLPAGVGAAVVAIAVLVLG